MGKKARELGMKTEQYVLLPEGGMVRISVAVEDAKGRVRRLDVIHVDGKPIFLNPVDEKPISLNPPKSKRACGR